MNKIGFVFLAISFLTFALFSGGEGVGMEYQLIISLSLIAFVGIPHGAIDHVLYLKEAKDKRPVRFYAAYLGTLVLYLLLWIVLPRLSLALFLVISAFHFGQSQLIEKVDVGKFWKNLISICWGASILSGLVVYNHEEITQLSGGVYDLQSLLPVFDVTVHTWILLISSVATLMFFIFLAISKRMSLESLVFETYILGLIHLAFFMLPLLIGFTLYFAILHSGKVLSEEYSYLKQRSRLLTMSGFVRMLVPYSALSLLGAGLIACLSYFEILPVSMGLLVIVLISVLTLPHSVVMDVFYSRYLNGNSAGS